MTTFLQAGKPVYGEDLIGREEEVQLIEQLVKQGQSVVLIAPRRFGKTSLLLEVMSRLKKKGYYTCYVDLFSTPTLPLLAEQITERVLENKKLDNAFHEIRKGIGTFFKNIELKHIIEEHEFILGFAEKVRDEFNLLKGSIDFIENFSLKYHKKIISGFDEFGDILKLDGNKIVKLFRSKLQLQKASTYIFSGSYESVMNQIFVSHQSPFYRFARIINLSFIKRLDFEPFIVSKLRENRMRISGAALTCLLDFTCGHPYYTQLMLQQLVLFYSKEKQVEVKQIKEVMDSLLMVEKNFLEKSWEEISKNRENIAVLLEIAQNKPSPYKDIDVKKINVGRALSNLTKNGTITKINHTYQFYDPLLHYWISKNIIR